jgi:hypothetical protein
MRQGHNPKLRQAIDEIKEILKKYDCAGVVTLHDGEGLSEYGLFIDTPTWSKVKMDGRRVNIGIHMKSDKANSEKTINMLFAAADLTGHLHGALVDLQKLAKQHVQIDETEPQWSPRIDGL